MKALSYVFGILLGGALSMGSMGCVAQAGTDESSQAEGLTADQEQPAQQQVQQQQPATMKQRMQTAPSTTHAVVHTTGLPNEQIEGLAGTDPGDNVTDDGDGKEPDPHPWHANKATLASH